MVIDLISAREQCNIDKATAAHLAGLAEDVYLKYEKKGEIPSKYAYNLWKEFPNYPLPKDFFCYTSFVLLCNMKYYKLNQTDIARLFGFANQSTISNFMIENIPMYEMKEVFKKSFKPLIVPMFANANGTLSYMTNLTARGNFMSCLTVKNMAELVKSD